MAAPLQLYRFNTLAFHDMAVSIAHFVAFEMLSVDMPVGFFTHFRRRTLVAVVRMETVVYVAPESLGAMKPRADADEDAVVKPLGAIVAVRGTGIRSNVIVTVGAIRGNTDVDGDLGFCFGGGGGETESCNRC
jgi:hypothetical protein